MENKALKRQPLNLTFKSCPKCNEEKPASEFYKDYRNSERLESWCKKCKALSTNSRVGAIKYWPHLSAAEGLSEYNRLFNLQMGCCSICDEHQSTLSKAMAVDHNHETGEVRGLLCLECNLGLGKFRDSSVILEKAINYLNKPRLSLVRGNS